MAAEREIPAISLEAELAEIAPDTRHTLTDAYHPATGDIDGATSYRVYPDEPNEEEKKVLRRVADKIPVSHFLGDFSIVF
jgi:hypothetical protein